MGILSRDELARLFCYGVAPTAAARRVLTNAGLRPGFIQGTSLVLENGRALNTIVLDVRKRHPLSMKLVEDNGSIFIVSSNGLIKVELPPLYSVLKETFRGREISEFATFHNSDTLFLTPYTGCIFAIEKEICKFCTFEPTKKKAVSPETVACWISTIADFRSESFSIALGAGSLNKNDHGVRYNAKIAELSAPYVDGVSVELVPPHELSDLKILHAAGVDSLVMSIEIWDDDIRADICPGKSYVSKESYIASWKYWNKISNSGGVSSVFIVGLEPLESLREGIKSAIGYGVVPTLIPFRPYDGIELDWMGYTDHNMYLEASDFCAIELMKAKLSPAVHSGCAKCGGCSLEIDVSLV